MKMLLALAVSSCGLLVAGCFFPPTECLNACSARHQSCVTRAASDSALQWCDYHLRQCTNQCHGRVEK